MDLWRQSAACVRAAPVSLVGSVPLFGMRLKMMPPLTETLFTNQLGSCFYPHVAFLVFSYLIMVRFLPNNSNSNTHSASQ